MIDIFYDIEKIKDELRPIMIVIYLQVSYLRHGKNIYILCPEHEAKTGRTDQHIGNCILGKTFNNAYHCFGCGATGNCFQLIKNILGLNTEKDFIKILEIAAEACGGKELFILQSSRLSKKNTNSFLVDKKNINTLSKEQLELIDLNVNNYPFIYNEYFSDSQKRNVNGLVKDANYNELDVLGFPTISYLSQKWLNYSINTILNNSEKAFLFIIKGKAETAMKKYKNLSNKDWKEFAVSISGIKSLDNNNLDCFCEKIKETYKNKYLEAESIWKMFATDDELNEIDNSWMFEYDKIIEKKPGMIL